MAEGIVTVKLTAARRYDPGDDASEIIRLEGDIGQLWEEYRKKVQHLRDEIEAVRDRMGRFYRLARGRRADDPDQGPDVPPVFVVWVHKDGSVYLTEA